MIAALAMLAAAVQGDVGQGGAVRGDTVLGRWQTETKHGVVEISRCGASICGHLLESDGIRADPQLRDVHNADAAQQQRLLKDILMLDGFHWKSDAWVGGWIYNAEDGGTYHATVSVTDATHLRVKGCIVWPLCKSERWTRLH